ncbi:MAG: flagellar filament capping protein FliD [Gemmatimonadota bacterium]
MSNPIGSFSGLASGVQWRDLVDQIMQIETQRKLAPVNARRTLAEKRVEAWTKYQALVNKFRDAAKTLRDPTGFGAFRTSGGTSATSGRTLLAATAGSAASPGTYAVEVLDLARANKLSGSISSSATQALGLSGEFALNGRSVTVLATDSLSSIRDKINALNVGATPSGASASILSTGSLQHRLVITADQTGASGIELVDDSAGILQSLGVVDGTKAANIAAGGGIQTHKVSSATAAIATMLGVTLPPPSTIEIGGRTITVDLAVDSLSSIAARVVAAGGNASVVTEAQGSTTAFRLVTSETVGASTVDGQRTLELLGFVRSGRSGIAQILRSENVYTNAAGTAATSTTLLSDLRVSGNAFGLVAGDAITIQGKRGDGSVVSTSLTIAVGDTVQTLLNRINDATSGFGAGSRTATASLSAGQILLSDAVAGDSQLSLSISATRVADGSVLSLGRHLTDQVGRLREVVAGTNALVRVDGVVLSRTTNAISDALSGVTLNLLQAEPGTTTAVTVERDSDALATRVKDLATTYNELIRFRTEQSVQDAPLRGNTSLRSSISTFTTALLTDVAGLTGVFARAGSAGLALQSDGTLKLDEAVFKSALATNFAEVVRLFSTGGTTTNSSLSYWASTARSVPGTYAVNITAAATVATITGSGFSGTYIDDGTADTLTITDDGNGFAGSIAVGNGDTIDTIVTRLNTMFAGNKLAVVASKSGNNLVLTGSRYGSAATITVAWTPGGANGTAQMGIAAGTFAGTDVAGTIGGLTATGSGQVLTGVAGGVTEGLAVTWSAGTTGAAGDITFVQGVGGRLAGAAEVVTDPGGIITTNTDSLTRSVEELRTRADTVQQQLDRRREGLIRQFVEMERALSRIQSQATALSSFITSLQASNNR